MKPLFNTLCTVFAAFVALTIASCADPLPVVDDEADFTEIEAGLASQVDAWNRGDIDAFMQLYVKGDSLRFASGNAIQYGWQATIERYRRAYPDKDHMGQLRFDIIATQRLAPEWITVFGRFHLTREESIGNLEGLFTLMFNKTVDGWLIVSDHTSSE
ncbi:MAG: DUF4440 domain-containing protein [Rhodothermales bacterium]|nr:DUF4440 domain-containing protein [Rhodothermales bacterium]